MLNVVDLNEHVQGQARALSDPSRFRLFQYIVESDDAVTVAELTELLGFNHNAIRQHLAVLVAHGLVDEANEERTTRGRPRKLYSTSPDALNAFAFVDGPYQHLSSLLLETLVSGLSPYEVGLQSVLHPTASSSDGDADSATQGLIAALRSGGFAPASDESGNIILGKCPFADLATENQGVVCELHRGLIDGQLRSPGVVLTGDLRPKDPHKAGCVVTLSDPTAET